MSNARKERTKIYATHLRSFCHWLNSTHPDTKTCSNITADIAKEYITYLRNQNGAPATKNDKLATLKMVFAHLGLPVNPFEKIKPMSNRQIQRDIFTPQQIGILFNQSTGWMRKLFITALATFQREEDCCLIKKSYIHLDINRVKFPFTYKTGQEINLPMLPLFREIVEEALNDPANNSEYLFPELAHLYTHNPSRIGKEVKAFLHDNGITNTLTEVDGYAKKVSTLDVHSLRHTAAVMAVLSGWPLPMVMKATGHKSLDMVMRYINHISEEQKENYFFQFGKGISGISQQNPEDERKQLADLAYSLPLEEVKKLLQIAQPAIAQAGSSTCQHLLL
jgi:integrase